MGSSGHQRQHDGDMARTFAEEEWENASESHLAVAVGSRDWQKVHRELRWSWELHVYVTASLFSVLAVLCLLAALRLRAQLSRSRNLASLNLFLGILASARLLVLFLDPYGSKLILPTVMLQVLWDLGYPSLVSAFCLLQLSAVRDAKMVFRLSESTASIVITFHFCLIITSGVLGAVQNWLRIVWIVTQIVFIVWGGFLFLSTLLGCLRILRSIVKVPLRFLTQVDPGCEVNNIVPLGMFTEESPNEQQQQQPNHHPPAKFTPHHPRIHITDVDDQTYSYASDASLAAHRELQRSESLPMRCLPATSPIRSHPLPDLGNSKKHRGEECGRDPAAVRPLIDRPRRYTMTEKMAQRSTRGPATIFRFEQRSPKRSLPRSLPSIFAEGIQKDTMLKHPNRSRLRHLVFTSALGIALCLLRAYDVFGLDGLMACGNTGPILQWFFFQTVSRFVELAMAFAMVCGSQQAMSSRYYYYQN